MSKTKIAILSIAVIGVILFAVHVLNNNPAEFKPSKQTHESGIKRIVSLAPSITESLFALGLDDSVVGVTRYCRYPAKTKSIGKVGGFLDPSDEAILRLTPDLVVMGPENGERAQRLESLGLRSLVVQQKTIPDILEAMIQIGEAADKQKEAADWVENANSEMEQVRRAVEGLKRPRVLVSMTRVFETGDISEVYVAGKNNFYDDLIELAGGVNAYDGSIIKTPAVSAEGIIALNPEIILDLVPDVDEMHISPDKALAQWQSLSAVSAIRNKRVYVLTGDYTVIPGPRFLNTMHDFVSAIHPEAAPKKL